MYISGQDMDNLAFCKEPTKIKSFLLRGILKNFNEDYKKPNYKNNFNYNDFANNQTSSNPPQENVKWFNEICQIKPVISNHCINLEYVKDYKYQDFELILQLPFVFKSAYAK